jgi:hypothetical protein
VSPVKYQLGSYIPEDDILHSLRRENLKFMTVFDFGNGEYRPCNDNQFLHIFMHLYIYIYTYIYILFTTFVSFLEVHIPITFAMLRALFLFSIKCM